MRIADTHPANESRTRNGRASRPLILVLFCLGAGSCPGLEAGCGFDGFAKADRYFPVTVWPEPGAERFEIDAMVSEFGDRNPRPVSRTLGRFPADGGPGRVLCRLGEGYGEPSLRCRVRFADGRTATRDLTPRLLTTRDILVLAVTDAAERFQFLGGIQLPRRGLVRVVPRTAVDFPDRWQEMGSVDLVILDGVSAPLAAEQREALAGWLAAGGTAVLTSRALLAGPENGHLGLMPEASFLDDYRRVESADMAGIFGKLGKYLLSVSSLGLRVAGSGAAAGAAEDVMIGVRDTGCGRVVALGFDWQEFELRDRIFYESCRQAVWEQVLNLIRPSRLGPPPRGLATPDEARTGFLLKYIAAFIALYVLVLGPANWLVLRRLKKLEYSILTIPAGAAAFSLAAFGIGVALRSRDTIVREMEVLATQNASRALVQGISGILAPDKRPYAVAFAGGGGILELDASTVRSAMRRPRLKDIPLYSMEPDFTIANVKIGTWSMGYLTTTSVADLGGVMSLTATAGADGLAGTVTNAAAFTLRDAWVIHRWNRTPLGDLAPGETRKFKLPLLPASRKIFPRDPRSRRYHGRDDSFSAKYCRAHPVSDRLGEMMIQFPLHRMIERPVLAGWQETPDSAIRTDRREVRAGRRRFCVCVGDLFIAGDDVAIPEGLVAASGAAAAGRGSWEADAAEIRIHEPAGPPPAAGRPGVPGGPEGDECGKGGRVYEFRLPFRAAAMRTDRLLVHWDAGETHPDDKPVEGVLSAYDWQAGTWVELDRAESGERTLPVEGPDRFLLLPAPTVRLRLAPAAGDDGRYYRANFLELGYAGWKVE